MAMKSSVPTTRLARWVLWAVSVALVVAGSEAGHHLLNWLGVLVAFFLLSPDGPDGAGPRDDELIRDLIKMARGQENLLEPTRPSPRRLHDPGRGGTPRT